MSAVRPPSFIHAPAGSRGAGGADAVVTATHAEPGVYKGRPRPSKVVAKKTTGMRASILVLVSCVYTAYAFQFPAPKADSILSAPTATKNQLRGKYQAENCCSNDTCAVNVDFSQDRFSRYGLVFYSNSFGGEDARFRAMPVFEREMVLFHAEAIRKGIPVSHTLYRPTESVNSRLLAYVRKSNRFATSEVFLPQHQGLADALPVGVNLGLSVEKYGRTVVNQPAFFSLSGLCHGSGELTPTLKSRRWMTKTLFYHGFENVSDTMVVEHEGMREIGQMVTNQQTWNLTFETNIELHPLANEQKCTNSTNQWGYTYIDKHVVLPLTFNSLYSEPTVFNVGTDFKKFKCSEVMDQLVHLADVPGSGTNGFLHFCDGDLGATIGQKLVCFAFLNCNVMEWIDAGDHWESFELMWMTAEEDDFGFVWEYTQNCNHYDTMFTWLDKNSNNVQAPENAPPTHYTAASTTESTLFSTEMVSFVFEFEYGMRGKKASDFLIHLDEPEKGLGGYETINKTMRLFKITSSGPFYTNFTSKDISKTTYTSLGPLCDKTCFLADGRFNVSSLEEKFGMELLAEKHGFNMEPVEAEKAPFLTFAPEEVSPGTRNLFFFQIEAGIDHVGGNQFNFDQDSVPVNDEASLFNSRVAETHSVNGVPTDSLKPTTDGSQTFVVHSKAYAVGAFSDGFSMFGGFDHDAVEMLNRGLDNACGQDACRVLVLSEPLGVLRLVQSEWERLTGRDELMGLCEYVATHNLMNYSLCISYDTTIDGAENDGDYNGMRYIDSIDPDKLKEIELSVDSSCKVTSLSVRQLPMNDHTDVKWPKKNEMKTANRLTNQIARWGNFEIGVQRSVPTPSYVTACKYAKFSLGKKMKLHLPLNSPENIKSKFPRLEATCEEIADENLCEQNDNTDLAKLFSRCKKCDENADAEPLYQSDPGPCGEMPETLKVATTDEACFYKQYSLGKKYLIYFEGEGAISCGDAEDEGLCRDQAHAALLSRCDKCEDYFEQLTESDPCKVL